MTRTPWTDHRLAPSAWRETGDGLAGSTPIVFLHGLGGTREAWNPQLVDLGRDRRCLAWDMPGYGDADPVIPLTFGAIATRLVELLDAAGIESADLVGLSFGGMHALHTARRFPDRVRRLVLADTSPAFGIDGTDRANWIRARLGPLDHGRAVADLAPEVLDAIVHRPLDPQVRAELIAAFARIGDAGFRAAVNCLPDHDLRRDLGRIELPTLVLVGEEDQETPVSYARLLADGLPNAELVVLPGIGHLSPSEDPAMFNRHLRRFLLDEAVPVVAAEVDGRSDKPGEGGEHEHG